MSFVTLLVSLGLTLLLEVPFAYLWGVRGRHDLELCVLVNVLTNPAVVLSYYLITAATHWGQFAVQIPLEAAAIAVEAFCYVKCGRNVRKPILLSACANGFSYCAGLMISVLI